MSIENELNRLKSLGRNSKVSEQQRQEARKAWDRINQNLILAAWERVRQRTAEYEALAKRLTSVVDNIKANRLTNAMDDLNGILSDLESVDGTESSGT